MKTGFEMHILVRGQNMGFIIKTVVFSQDKSY